VVGDSVIVFVDQDKKGASFVAAVDRDTGKVRWRTPRDSRNFSASTPCVYRDAGGNERIICTSNANGFTAIDPRTGKIAWELPGTFNDRVVSSPLVAGDLLIGAAGEGARGKGVVAVDPPDAEQKDAKVAYKLDDEVPYVPTPLAYKDRLFTWSDAGVVTCWEADTGKQIWRGKAKGGFFGSPVCAAGKLYCVSKRGEVAVVDATADKFKLLAQNDLGEASDATPAIANKRMYVRTLTHLICVTSDPVKPGAVGRAEP
jgi:outer membrane protein assembly factor BamB